MNDQAMPESQPNAAPAQLSPGAQLAAFRQEHGWTVEQVASQLNLAPRQIAAIENGDYAALPGMPIVRGFVRQYAKLLKVDAAPLLATMGGETVHAQEPMAPRPTLATPFSEARLPSMMDRPALPFKWIVVLLLAVLLGAAIWALQQGRDLAGISKTATSQVKDGLTQMSSAVTAQQREAPKVEAPNVGEQKAEASATTTAPGTVTEAIPVPPVAVPAPAPVAPATPTSVAPPPAAPAPTSTPTPTPSTVPAAAAPVAGKDTLVLRARADSWVEVKRAGNNSVVISRLVKAGETESVEVSEPVSVVIGNVTGVEASWRGAPLELKAGGNSNVARLTLK
jgi:cytoskeleton protein RodZ